MPPVDPARSSAGSVLFTTYNVLDLGAAGRASGAGHYDTVAESIRALGTDVLAVQEICAPGLPAARALLRRLADDTGLRCLVPGPGGGAVPALCPGSRGYHLGLLWRDGIEPVPGSFHSRNADFWHALGWIALDVGGPWSGTRSTTHLRLAAKSGPIRARSSSRARPGRAARAGCTPARSGPGRPRPASPRPATPARRRSPTA